MNPGLRIWKYANALTAEQLAELLAIKHTTVDLERPTCLHVMHGKEPIYRPLIARKMITWETAPVEWSSAFRSVSLTKLGEQVMLHRIHSELIKAGVIPVQVMEPE